MTWSGWYTRLPRGMPRRVSTIELRGWQVLRMTLPPIEVEVLPEKGGDILALRWLPLGINLLWTSPWGLRRRGSVPPAGDSLVNFLANYPGGWQTIFPNGGNASVEKGVELGFHGEACLVPWDCEEIEAGDDRVEIRLQTELSASPFALARRLSLTQSRLEVFETATNLSGVPMDAMWSHHPAFGEPFISGATRVDCAASRFIADDERDVKAGDLEPGSVSAWPFGRSRDGGEVDLRTLPALGSSLDRFGYLDGFAEGRATITNPELPLAVEMEWDASVFPYAWYWLEANATADYPWYGRAYVFALEPASSYPGQGIAAVRQKTGTLLRFNPGEEKTATLSMALDGGGSG